MRCWKWWSTIVLLAALIGLGGCAQGISQTDYDQVKSDLVTAETRIQNLEAELNSTNSQSKKLQTDYTSITSERDKAKSEAEMLQKALTQGAPYLRIMDLSLEQQRSEVGIRPIYWQYTESYTQTEITKAVADSRDATLKSLWDIFQQNPQNESRWFSYTIAAVTSILNGKGIPAAVLPAAPVVAPSPDGQTLLRVKILRIDGTPVSNLEVNLWANNAGPPTGPPPAVMTNTSGIATFAVSAGNYYIGFNRSNFPAVYLYFNGRGAQMKVGMTTDIEIRLFKKEG